MTQMFDLRTMPEAGFVARPHSTLLLADFSPQAARIFLYQLIPAACIPLALLPDQTR
jgi:hypothetical protein